MYPNLLEWPIQLPAFFTMEIIAFIIGIYLAVQSAKKEGFNPVEILDLTIVIFVFSLIGAKIFHVLFDGHLQDYINMCVSPFDVENMAKYYPNGCKTDQMCAAKDLGNICNLENGKCYYKSCFAAFDIFRGGFVFYGGLLGGFLSATIFVIKKRLEYFKVADLLTPMLALGLAIGRLGCFFAGCCYGSVTDSFLGISFPKGSPAFKDHLEHFPHLMHSQNHSLAVLPTQIFSALAHFLLFLYLYFYLRKKKRYNGQVFIHFLTIYSSFRFFIEFFRGDERGNFLFFSTSQWLSLLVIFLVIIAKLTILKNKKIINNTKEGNHV